MYNAAAAASHSLCHEFFGAEGMSDIFQRVTEAVGIVVQGVDAPLTLSARVWNIFDAISHWVLLAVGQYNLHSERGFTFFEFSFPHVLFRNEWLGMKFGTITLQV